MLEWLLVMFPLVFSPGPANIIASISGARGGIKRSLPLFAGIDVVYFVYSMVMGLGVGGILLTEPKLMAVLKYAGATFIVWLGIKMWFRSKHRDHAIHLGFKEGFMIQAMNPKFPIILVTMFSVFLQPLKPPLMQVLTLSLGILALNIFTQLTWAAMGKTLKRHLGTDEANTRQDQIFAVLMAAVGLWIAFR